MWLMDCLGVERKIRLFMSFTAAATENQEMFGLLCRVIDFFTSFFFFFHTAERIPHTTQGCSKNITTTAHPPEHSHTTHISSHSDEETWHISNLITFSAP